MQQQGLIIVVLIQIYLIKIMKWLVNTITKSSLAITLLVINLWLLINDWSNHAFAGTITAEISNVKMTEVNLNNNIWQQPQGFYGIMSSKWKKLINCNFMMHHHYHSQKQSYNEPYDQRIEDLKKFNRAQRQALDNPTLKMSLLLKDYKANFRKIT
ncbi:putative f pilus assembly protein TraF [Rickettsia hoogstraalii str. RCCE3]|nr:putative f pilus assembly protein TraF [Rickettsia hoogstraalii str. RCCE3]